MGRFSENDIIYQTKKNIINLVEAFVHSVPKLKLALHVCKVFKQKKITTSSCILNMSIRRIKKSFLFPLTRATLVFHAYPQVFFSSISEKNPHLT